MAASAHALDFTRGAARRELPRADGGGGLVSIGPLREVVRADALKALAEEVRPTKRRKNIMSMLATGWLPWGIDWRHNGVAGLPLCGDAYVMCCGHELKKKEAQAFVDAGLLEAGPLDRMGRPTLVITPAGRDWLSWVW